LKACERPQELRGGSRYLIGGKESSRRTPEKTPNFAQNKGGGGNAIADPDETFGGNKKRSNFQNGRKRRRWSTALN